jgi:hypothetical protein
MRGVGGVASRSGPGAFLSENLEENPVAGESGPPPQFRGVLTPPPVLAPPMSCNRYVEHLNPQRTKASARPCRGRDPAEGWRFSGGRDSETGSGARDPCGRLSESRVGRRVRISAASLQTLGPSREISVRCPFGAELEVRTHPSSGESGANLSLAGIRLPTSRSARASDIRRAACFFTCDA